MSDLIKSARELRVEIKAIAEKVRALHAFNSSPEIPTMFVNEAADNIELAYRHLEDAGMRLGKTIQAADGGVSVYDKTEA